MIGRLPGCLSVNSRSCRSKPVSSPLSDAVSVWASVEKCRVEKSSASLPTISDNRFCILCRLSSRQRYSTSEGRTANFQTVCRRRFACRSSGPTSPPLALRSGCTVPVPTDHPPETEAAADPEQFLSTGNPAHTDAWRKHWVNWARDTFTSSSCTCGGLGTRPRETSNPGWKKSCARFRLSSQHTGNRRRCF